VGAPCAYDEKYFEKRRGNVDRSEWLDIYWALRALGVPRDAIIVDLGAGEGGLVRYLRRKGYRNTIGFDVAVENEYVKRMDLTRETPRGFDVCVFQHFLEHIPQERAVELLAHCVSEGVAAVGIVPGHFSDDPTHIVNHYEYEEALDLARRAAARAGGAYRVEPDTLSYLSPEARDWIIALARHLPEIPPLKPLPIRLARKALALTLAFLVRAGVRG
jgi:hypothetical protein